MLKKHSPLYKNIIILFDLYSFFDKPDKVSLVQSIEQTGMAEIDYSLPVVNADEYAGRTNVQKSSLPWLRARPVNILSHKEAEALYFPCLFPNGRGTFADPREKRITVRDYYQNRLLHRDNRFRTDMYEFFCSQLAMRLRNTS